MHKYMRKYLYFFLASLTYLIVHEGVHIIQAHLFGIYEGLRMLPFGIEVIYYVTLVFMLLDPVYISLLSFFIGGDINGIAVGLHVSYGAIRVIYLIIAIVSTYWVYKKLYPAYTS